MFKFIRRFYFCSSFWLPSRQSYRRDVKQVMTYQSLVREVLDVSRTQRANEEPSPSHDLMENQGRNNDLMQSSESTGEINSITIIKKVSGLRIQTLSDNELAKGQRCPGRQFRSQFYCSFISTMLRKNGGENTLELAK